MIKKTRWENEQNRKKERKQKVGIAGWMLFFFVLVLGVILLKVFFVVRESNWNGKSVINVVFEGKNIAISSFNPSTHELVFIPLPENLYLEVTNGYGEYRVGAISALGNLDERQNLLSSTIEENFGISIFTGVNSREIVFGEAQINDPGKLRDYLKDLCFRALSGKVDTGFKKWDLIRFWFELGTVKASKIYVINLEKINSLEQGNLSDQTKIVTLIPRNLDEVLKKYLSDSEIKKEKLTVEVLNGTEIPGLAEKASRILSNLGQEVIGIQNADKLYDKCRVESLKENRNSNSVKKTIEIFNCSWIEKSEEGKADITLIIGEDYWKKLSEK